MSFYEEGREKQWGENNEYHVNLIELTTIDNAEPENYVDIDGLIHELDEFYKTLNNVEQHRNDSVLTPFDPNLMYCHWKHCNGEWGQLLFQERRTPGGVPVYRY